MFNFDWTTEYICTYSVTGRRGRTDHFKDSLCLFRNDQAFEIEAVSRYAGNLFAKFKNEKFDCPKGYLAEFFMINLHINTMGELEH